MAQFIAYHLRYEALWLENRSIIIEASSQGKKICQQEIYPTYSNLLVIYLLQVFFLLRYMLIILLWLDQSN